MSLSYASSTLHASNIETELCSLAADMQRLHKIAHLQPADVTRFAQLERSVDTQLEWLAEALARQTTIARM